MEEEAASSSTEDILLGVVRENEGVAARILLDFDADSESIARAASYGSQRASSRIESTSSATCSAEPSLGVMPRRVSSGSSTSSCMSEGADPTSSTSSPGTLPRP